MAFKMKGYTPFTKDESRLSKFWKGLKHTFTPQTRSNLGLGRDKDGKITGSIRPRDKRD